MTTNDLRALLREGFDSPKKWYSLEGPRSQSTSSAELIIFDVIGWYPNDADTLVRDLRSLDVDEIVVRINSGGGSAFDGFAIYNALRSHDARVTTIVEGYAASAASLIALAGDDVVMRPASELMIHEAWTAAAGPAADMRKVADELDRLNGLVAGVYAEKAGTPVDMWREAMRIETWFTPDEAVESGLVDRVHDGRNVTEPSNRSVMPIFNYAGRREAPAPAVQTSSALAEDNRKESSMADLMNELRQRLGVADADADEGTILAALDEALNERAADEDPDVDPSGEADETPDEDDQAEEAPANTVEPDEETVVLDKEVYADLLARAEKGDEFDEKTTREDAEEFVQDAIDAGKLSAASKDRWVTRVLGDPEDAKARINQMASGRVPREELGRGGSDNEASDNLSAAADRSGFATRPKL